MCSGVECGGHRYVDSPVTQTTKMNYINNSAKS